ncbi:MAG: hypothetical protein QOH37_1895 [Nocardioidaceae bacterium]|jgi:hypothetical protein|nr:hypothetical protein [Nocardioidaceae bacterium]
MFAIGLPELLVFLVLALLVLYVVIRLAVKHGTREARPERETDGSGP